jgi:aminoglycoside phosphotransferase (APT) family kinase protein
VRLHNVSPSDVGLENLSKPSGYYERQVLTLSTISAAQALVTDKDTQKNIGPVPYAKELLKFFNDKEQRPSERTTLVHGDYKIDNLVFHKTEPRLIGILE